LNPAATHPSHLTDPTIVDWYYLASPRDLRMVKALVAFTYVMSTAQIILMAHDSFNAYARHFGDFGVLDEMQTDWLSVPVFTAISGYNVFE
jgi:hypothetical protein